MSSTPTCRISLVIPCYNVADFVSRCIRTCLTQDIPSTDYEIILVDDGATDNTGEILLQWEKKSPNIQVIRQKNLGLGGARNTGLLNAKGNYVWFIDSDDWIAENCLGALLQKAEAYQVDLLYFHAKKILPDDVEMDFGSDLDGGPFRMSECALQKIQLSAWIELYRRDFLISKDIRFAEHFLHEDTDFNSRVFAYDPKVFFLPDQYYFYDNRRMNSITNSKEMQMQHDNLKILERFVSFSQETEVAQPLKSTIFRYLFMVCVVSNYPLQYHFTEESMQMVKEYKQWIMETGRQAKYFPVSVISFFLKYSVPLFIFSLKSFQYIALLQRKIVRRKG